MVACTSRGTGTPAWLRRTPCQFTGRRTFPAASTATRNELASAVHGGVAAKQVAWKSFGRGSAVKCGKVASGVGAQLPVAAWRSSMQARRPVCVAHVAPASASPHGRGSAAPVTAIVTGPASPAGAWSAVVSGKRNVSAPALADSPACGWETQVTGVDDLLCFWQAVSWSTTPGAAQSAARTTRRRAAVDSGVKALVPFASGVAGIPDEAASQPSGSTITRTKSPGAAKGRLVAPRLDSNVFETLGMMLHAACSPSGATKTKVPRAKAQDPKRNRNIMRRVYHPSASRHHEIFAT